MEEQAEEIRRVTISTPPTKNPKSVEAGRKGAAARQAKENALKEELRRAKDALVEKEEDIAPPTQDPPPAARESTNGPWIPIAIAAATALGLYWLKRTPNERVHSRVAQLPRGADVQLKTAPDPFYMQ